MERCALRLQGLQIRRRCSCEAYRELFETADPPGAPEGLSAASVYTQLSDVEDEVNGFVTYDRKVEKLDAGAVRAINQRLISDAMSKKRPSNGWALFL